jgi:uncharacterized protein with HEPN domain
MPPEERDAALLLDMLNAARAIATFVAGKHYEEYEKDLLLKSAVERMIEIIGEAARGVSATLKDAHPEIPWKGIIGQRNVLAHDYGRIIHARIWDIATLRVPDLIRKLERLLPPIPDEPEL